jgi:two-component system OmpR family sensor kinase/two-component system sensor histidine kinase BaeS
MRPPQHGPFPRRWQHLSHEEYLKRRFLFRRMARPFGFMVFTFLMLMCGIATLIHYLQGSGPLVRLVWMAGCGLSVGFPLLALAFAVLAFREFGPPLSNVMAAADAVAEGNLEVRVPENAPGEFGRLARSFNRMTGELARAEQQRRNLTADVAHELRTPLHVIQGNLEGILDGVYEPTPEHINATLEETRLLARLVNDLQTLSLAEAGQLPLHPQQIAVADLLADVATSFSGQAAEAGVEIRVNAPPPNAEIYADADRLDQVLSNLVSNALRYTPSGGCITLAGSLQPDGIRLTVADTGAGISAEDLPFIFDRFWRGDRARARLGGGTGLGLAIARQLIQAHGGQIYVSSEMGHGSMFTIDLPHSSQP